MRKTLLFIIVFTLLRLALFSDDDPKFRLGLSAMNSPVSNDSVYQANDISFNSDLSAGLDFGGFLIEAKVLFDYVSVNGHDNANPLIGAWMNLGGTVDVGFNPLSWLSIKAGVGGVWQKSSLQFDNSGWLGLSQPGIVGLLDIRFIPIDVFEIELRNRIDAIFSFDNSGAFSSVLPNYNAGLRATFHPGIKWLGIFVEGDAFLWNYSSSVINVSNWILKAQAGLMLDFRFDKNADNKPADSILQNEPKFKQLKASTEIKTNPSADTSKNAAGDEELDPAIIAFSKLKPGSEVTFTMIQFEEKTDKLTKESIPVLDKISKILSRRKTATILVSAYGPYSGDLLKDYARIKNRANTIRSYLSKHGVDVGQVKVSASGQVIKPDDKNGTRPTVVLKIISG
jgi:outer membrane protein OmpA-like peptidoglycan-associated protein